MKQLKNGLLGVLLIASLGLRWTPVHGVEAFEQAGPISAIGHAGFTVEQQEYRIAPGARLQSFDSRRRSLSDFRVGDIVIFKGKVISDIYYVDMVTYYAPKPL